MCVPFLTDLGYDKTWSAGLIAVAGGLGVIIPPSIPFVLYSLATGVSTGDLFLGGVLPGILIGVALMAYAVYYCAKNGEDKEKIKARMDELAAEGKSIIMISSEMPEILGMCDRVYVMNEGRIVAEMDIADASQEKIMAAILKSEKKEEEKQV